MQKSETLEFGNYYHIYNRGINSCNLFDEADNYNYFLSLYDRYIEPVADTFAWVLMPNHFHFLVRIKDEVDYPHLPHLPHLSHLTGFKNLSGVASRPAKPPHQYFSNLFNAYTKAYNKRNERHGSLFERPFKRKLISNEIYMKNLILYIHKNPVHHGYCKYVTDYIWSSYASCISTKPTKLKRNVVIDWFNDKANFIYVHKNEIDMEKIEKWLEI